MKSTQRGNLSSLNLKIKIIFNQFFGMIWNFSILVFNWILNLFLLIFKMNLEYAHAKLQSLEAEAFFIRCLPTSIGCETHKQQVNELDFSKLHISSCHSMYFHCKMPWLIC